MKYCRYCGALLDEDSKFCPSCGKAVNKASETIDVSYSGNKPTTFHTLAKVFLILSIIVEFWMIIPLITGIIGLNKLNSANNKDDLVGIGIVCLIFNGLLAGLFMLLIPDEEF
jgi:uncharacterized membrane protein YvbJ